MTLQICMEDHKENVEVQGAPKSAGVVTCLRRGVAPGSVSSRSTGDMLWGSWEVAARATLSDESERIDSEIRVLTNEPVHGCLVWVAHVADAFVPCRWRRGEVPSDLMHQRAPESRTGSVWLRSRCSLYRKVVYFNVFNQFRGVHNRRHNMTPCPRMLPIVYGGCLLRSTLMRRHSVRRRGRDSPQQSSVRGIMTHSVIKEKLIVFIKIRKKSNDEKR
jgi:hypothetical protein